MQLSAVPVVLKNDYNATKNVSFHFNVYDQSGSSIFASPTSSNNVDPFETAGNFLMNDAVPAISGPFTSPTHYTFESILNTSPDKKSSNDTVRHVQEFSNYYAYDDGTAEAAVGLSTLYGMLAEKFTVTVADTLRAIDIFFNPIITDASYYTFRFNVWDNAGGVPGSVLYTSDTTYPVYSSQINKFKRCYLDTLLPLHAGGTYFIGFTQNTTQFLNVGLDRNTNTQDKVYYNVSGPWYNSPFTGSLMMHPVLGTQAEFVGVNEHPKTTSDITLFPNPVTDRLNLRPEGWNLNKKVNYSITDVFGRTVLSEESLLPEYIDVSELSNGVYFIRFVSGSSTSTGKFIISK
jgi:hypothetical protein